MKILQLGALDRLRALHLSPSDEVQAASTKVLASLGEILPVIATRDLEPQVAGTTPSPRRLEGAAEFAARGSGPGQEGMGASSRLASDLALCRASYAVRLTPATVVLWILLPGNGARAVDSGRGRRSEPRGGGARWDGLR